MTNLVVEHAHEASGQTLDGALSVGRGADNDVVLDHPTVSRHHAIIERRGDAYFISDLRSRNGTRVNARAVRERRPLAHGDRIRFGQVRVTFVVNDDAGGTASLDHGQSSSTEPGILFDCACGVRLWAKEEAATGVVMCGKCKAQVVVPEESSSSDSGETVAGLAFAAPPEHLAAPVQTGTCSICQWTTSTDDQITTCPACGLTFHAECWAENRGCSAYGCAQVNALRPQPEATSAREADVGTAIAPTVPERVDDAPARLPAELALLAASAVGAVLGFLAFGAISMVTLAVSAIMLAQRHGERSKLLLAIVLSLLGAIGGCVVSSIWWLGRSPGASP